MTTLVREDSSQYPMGRRQVESTAGLDALEKINAWNATPVPLLKHVVWTASIERPNLLSHNKVADVRTREDEATLAPCTRTLRS